MRVVIAGGHGKIALLLEGLLAARGDTAIGLIRNPAHAAELIDVGAQPLVRDLERTDVAELAGDVRGADAVVFAAGAGPGSGAARKDSVDRGAATLLADAAATAGVRRYVQVGSTGVDAVDQPGARFDAVFTAYLRAKKAAEQDLVGRDLDWTVLRPGQLTDESPTGLVRLTPPPIERGPIPRADVAAVLVALLDEPATAGLVLELISGDRPVLDAVRAVARN
jgi:uncharacterized protein YbjT (DUF2867 family)